MAGALWVVAGVEAAGAEVLAEMEEEVVEDKVPDGTGWTVVGAIRAMGVKVVGCDGFGAVLKGLNSGAQQLL